VSVAEAVVNGGHPSKASAIRRVPTQGTMIVCA
jgi:hypothetical protein